VGTVQLHIKRMTLSLLSGPYTRVSSRYSAISCPPYDTFTVGAHKKTQWHYHMFDMYRVWQKNLMILKLQ